MSLLKAENISYFYQDGETKRYILKNMNANFEAGKFYTILGKSGSGKTTLLSLISALDSPKEGVISLNDIDIKKSGYETYRRNSIGIIFQNYNLVPYLSAVENVLVTMSVTENELPKNHRNVAYNLLKYIGIDKVKADRRVNKLSGGEQQRVAIARALATNVDVILADEPTGNLDSKMAEEIVEIFRTLAHEHGKCVIVVTHSQEVADQSDEILHLQNGVIQ